MILSGLSDSLNLNFGTHSYDVILTGGEKEILPLFRKSNASILMSAEEYCWPDPSLSPSYPRVEYPGKRFLNSGGFIGYAPHVYDMITSQPLDREDDDDQLFLTRIFLNPDSRAKWNMKLDSRSEIFQTLNGIPAGEVEIRFHEVTGDAFMVNTVTRTRPLVIHGNGGSKMHLNSLSNYLARSWNSLTGCLSCLEHQEDGLLMRMTADEGIREANTKKDGNVQAEEGGGGEGVDSMTPAVRLVIGIFIQRPTPFLPQFFHHVHALNYPKDWISLVIHSPVQYHDEDVKQFMGHNVTGEYHSVRLIGRQGQTVVGSEEKDEEAMKRSGADDVATASRRGSVSKEEGDASGSLHPGSSVTGSSSDQVVTEARARTMGL